MEGNKTNEQFIAETSATDTLKTLTTLTYIGCALSYLGTLYSFIKDASYEKDIVHLNDMLEKSDPDSFAGKALQDSITMMQKSHDNKYILLLSGLLFTTLCLAGAMQMRKRKKSGFPLYLIGEIAPFAISIILIGTNLTGSIALGIFSLIALVFIILYSAQLKNMN